MKITKKIIAMLLCTVVCFSMSIISYATNDTAKITVSTADAMPGDTVTINISIDQNPGIMAMAFCITYDNTSLVYKNYSKGYLSSYTIKDHSDKGHVSFVNVENKDNASNGTIISLTFDVKENAKPGKSVITLANSNRDKHGAKLHNSFSNSKQEFIVPVVTSGGVTIAETCENAGHKYSEWEIIRENTCTDDGLKSHICSRCNNFEEVVIPAAHSFEAEWTIDKAATPEEDGIMSRHCTACDAKTDEFTFKYEEIGGDDTPDDSSSTDSSSTENSSQESETPSSDTENTSSNISSDESNVDKPNIDNVVGEKVPQQEAEKFEEYVPPKQEENSSEETTNDVISSETTSTESNTPSSDTTVGTTQNNSSKTDEEPSFFATPIGIAVMVVLILISVAVIALGIIIIMRKQKS